MAVMQAKNKPNEMQQGLAQYATLQALNHRRQLHQYPPGIGKSRIIPDIANQLLTHGMAKRVLI